MQYLHGDPSVAHELVADLQFIQNVEFIQQVM